MPVASARASRRSDFIDTSIAAPGMPSIASRVSHRSDLSAPSITAAIKSGLFSQVRYLLELGHSPAATDSEGRSPLCLCSLIEEDQWALSLCRLLLEKGASVGQCDKVGLNALHYACIYARDVIIPVLLPATDFDLNVPDRHGNSALFYAASSGSLPVLTALISSLKRFELTLDRANCLGVTPLMQAWRCNNIEAAMQLLHDGADPMRIDSEGRSCRSYETDARKVRKRRDMEDEARKLFLNLRLDDSAGWRRWRKLRATSAPNGTRNSWHEVIREQKLNQCVTRRQDSQLIHTASALDVRNDPQKVFDADPVNFFDKRLNSGKPRPLTAHHKRRRAQSPLRSSSQPQLNQDKGTWRGEVAKLYQQYECQCSGSYREAARSPSPTVSIITSAAEQLGNKEMVGLTVEAINELSSGNSRSSRRGSAISQRSASSIRDLSRKIGKNRKGSGSRQSMESVLEDEDLQALSQLGIKTRKRLSIDVTHRNLPRAINKPQLI